MHNKKFAFAILLLLAASFALAGCAGQPISYDDTGIDELTPDADNCASCTCLVCERGTEEIDEGIMPDGFEAGQLAQFGATTLKGGKCWLQACDLELKRDIRDSNGKIFQKSFMLGVAVDSYDEADDRSFTTASQYCPMTDKWCYYGEAGAKDRWENVYLSYGIPAGDIPEKLTVPVYNDLVLDPSKSDVLCLFQGSRGQPYPPEATDAPASLFCASGACSREFTYDSWCRKDIDGDGTFSFTDADGVDGDGDGVPDGNGFPDEQVPCDCRQISKYDEDHDTFFQDESIDYANGGSADTMAGQLLCHAPYANGAYTVGTSLDMGNYQNLGALPVYAQCNSGANAVDGECIAYHDEVIGGEARRYCVEWKITSAGECDANANTQLDFVDINQYGSCEGCIPLMDTALVYEGDSWLEDMTSMLKGGVIPVVDARSGASPAFVAGKISDNDLHPAIILSSAGEAAAAKSACPECLISIPQGSSAPADSFDLFTVSAYADAATLVQQAKAVRQQPGGEGKAFIIVLANAQDAAQLALEENILQLSNAGYVGIIATTYVVPPYETSTFNTLGTNENVFAAPGAEGSFAFFEACGEYYNGQRNTFYMRQAPKQCGCIPCQGAFCGDTALVCGGSGGQGLTCLDGAGNPVLTQPDPLDPSKQLQCASACVAFPTQAVFNPEYVCGTGGSAEDLAQGCYNICNKRYGGSLIMDSTRGYAEILSEDIANDATGVLRYTPTTCYMQDSNGNFHIYQKTPVGTPASSQIVIFDTIGGEQACGAVDINEVINGQPELCALPEDMPAVVIR